VNPSRDKEELPDSVPPGKACEIEVTVDPPLVGANQFVRLAVVGGDSLNGSATVSPDRITKTSKVKVTGGAMSTPDATEPLVVVAGFNGALVAESATFRVCAHPVRVKEVIAKAIVPTDVIETTPGHTVTGLVGAIAEITCESDSGTTADLVHCGVQEVVNPDLNKPSPPFHRGGIQQQSEYVNAAKGMSDFMGCPVPYAGPEGDDSKAQAHRFRCRVCGAEAVIIPYSGFQITDAVKQGGDKRWVYEASKRGKEVYVLDEDQKALRPYAGDVTSKVKLVPYVLTNPYTP
jgi:hypothetical protein